MVPAVIDDPDRLGLGLGLDFAGQRSAFGWAAISRIRSRTCLRHWLSRLKVPERQIISRSLEAMNEPAQVDEFGWRVHTVSGTGNGIIKDEAKGA